MKTYTLKEYGEMLRDERRATRQRMADYAITFAMCVFLAANVAIIAGILALILPY